MTFKHLSLSLLLLSAGMFSACTSAPEQTPSLLPTPAALTQRSGSFLLKAGLQIGVSDTLLLPAAAYLQEVLGGEAAATVSLLPDASQADISLCLGLSGTKSGAYTLRIDRHTVQVQATDYVGVVSAIATLRQLLPVAVQTGATRSLPAIEVADEPRFEWRGFMLDASRHFWNKEEVKRVIDLMAQYKLNKFHWHLTDDQGWRIEIKQYPLLTERGAWRTFNDQDRTCLQRAAAEDNPDLLLPEEKLRVVDGDTLYGGYYTQEDIREVVAYAAQRGIDIIPEIDMPGHLLAAIDQYPDLACDGLVGWGETFSSPLCPGKESTLEFCRNVFKEVFTLFPYAYVHIGGDEVDKHNWQKCARCRQRIRTEQLGSVEELQAWFVRGMEQFFHAHGKKLMGWDEVVADGLSADAAITWWRSWSKDAVATATAQGQKVVVCTNEYFYFDYAEDRHSIRKILNYDPCADDVLSVAQKERVWGLQANLWTEWVPTMRRIEFMILPRLLALSEVAWAQPERKQRFDDFYRLLVPQFRRMEAMQHNYRIPDLHGFYKVNAFLTEARVDITCPLPGITIRYTTDGTLPTPASARYDGSLKIDTTTFFTFRTFRPDGTASGTANTTYVQAPYAEAVATVPAALKPGLKAVWHDFRGEHCADIEAAPVKGSYVVDAVTIPEGVGGNIGLVITGYIDVPADAIYTFALLSDDGSTLALDGELLGDNDGPHSPVEIIVQKAFKAGLHPLRVCYFDSNGGTLSLALVNEQGERTPLPNTWLKHE